jgi:hypothetical protein
MRRALLLLLLVLGASVSLVSGANNEPGSPTSTVGGGFQSDRQAQAYFRTATASDGNSFNAVFTAAKAAGWVFGAFGRENIPVSPRFAAPGGFVAIRWVTIFDPSPVSLGPSLATLTDNTISPIVTFTGSSGYTDTNGRYYSDFDWTFSSQGGTYGIAWVVSCSPGNEAYIRVGSF